VNPRPLDRFLGCLLGGAVGDALGAPVEHLSLDEIRRRFGPSGVAGYVEFWSGQGAFTDDTQMSLFTAEGLIMSGPREPGRAESDGEDLFRRRRQAAARLESVHRSYLRWLLTQGQEPNWAKARTTEASLKSEGRLIKEKGLWVQRSPGMTCLAALRSGRSGTTADPINVSKGCGGVMRAAPAGLWSRGPEEAFRLGCEIAAITHGNPSGFLPAGFLASMISVLGGGGGLDESIDRSTAILRTWNGHGETLDSLEKARRLAEAGTGATSEDIEQISGTGRGPALGGGWTAEEALAIAVYGVLRFPDDFRGGVLAAVNHDGDSDSTAAVAGNILGTKLGRDGVPREWIEGLDLGPLVERTARELFAAAAPVLQ
jgi:ADP-ribosylglycohydrolase